MRSGGVARRPATPCRQEEDRKALVTTPGSEPRGPASGPSSPTAHGSEGKMYLVREPLMSMLTVVGDDRPIMFHPFKMRGAVLAGLQGKTLGSRKRFLAGDVARPRLFVEEPSVPVAPAVVESVSQRLELWSPAPDEAQGRHAVVVDAILTQVLREHQRVGVQFLFDCLMGLRDYDGYGCILADDMGLGKTLQSVSIIWTLLMQGGPHGQPVCRKAVIICPASLVKNWGAEFDKWLHGKCKYTAVSVSGCAAVRGTLMTFVHDREAKVLILSYETFRGYAAEVAACGIDLVVCDEAHKLKNDDAAVTKCITNLSAKRKLLISGTPIQNNLDEFYTLASVANPGIFGDATWFKKNFSNPILRGREPTSTEEERQKGQDKLEHISAVTGQFILRRTNRLNARFLPPKQLFNIFVEPTEFQRRLYRSFLKSNLAKKILSDGNGKLTRTVLHTIQKLQSLVNHPFLVRSATQKLEAGFDDDGTKAMFEDIDRLDGRVRTQQKPVREALSGKLALLHGIIVAIKESGSGDRIVIISNWTQTLDLIEKMCEQNKWGVHRLDGTMAVTRRMKLVTDFNRVDNDSAFCFLLSSKAGGCGLNLIGANRLVMYDPDWNPANDRQAMARVWRDGQKKQCYIYRLFTTGTIDEKIYQRQICKDGLSAMMVTETGGQEAAAMKECLSADLVRDLFCFDEESICATHDMLECKRCKGILQKARCSNGLPLGKRAVPQEELVDEEDLHTWAHHVGAESVDDPILEKAAARLLAAKHGGAGAQAELGQGTALSFCMGCRIEFTAETIAKLEEEDRAEQQRREEAATLRLADKTQGVVGGGISEAPAAASSSGSSSNRSAGIGIAASGSASCISSGSGSNGSTRVGPPRANADAVADVAREGKGIIDITNVPVADSPCSSHESEVAVGRKRWKASAFTGSSTRKRRVVTMESDSDG